MEKKLRFCPNCGRKVYKNRWIIKYGSASQTMGHGSCSFKECPHCQFQFNLRRPTNAFGDYEFL